MDESLETIAYKERDGVAWLTFTCQKFLNAFSEEMPAELFVVGNT